MAGLTPLQLIAGAELANNTAISLSENLTTSIDNYRSTALIAPLATTLTNGQITTLLGNLVPTLTTLTATNCPSLSDSTPAAFAGTIGNILTGSAASGNSITGFTGVVTNFGELYLGNGDNSIFAQLFTAVDGYVVSTNEYILSVNNSSSYLGSNFTSMNSLITGDLDQVSQAFPAFGNDLKNLGIAIDLENLNSLGFPIALCQQLLNVGGLTPRLVDELESRRISQEDLFDPPTKLSSLLNLNKTLYQIFSNITGNDLEQILDILNVTTPGISKMSDLLDPVKIFPQSFFSLTVKTVDGLRGVYVDPAGSVNVRLIDSLPKNVLDDYRLLSQIIPSEKALANQCIRVSLQQITNIFNLTLPSLADSYLNLVTTKELELINQLTEPVPESVRNFYSSSFATGSGPEGTLLISDFIGAVAGTGYIDPITTATAIFNSSTSDANFSNLIVTYQRMNTTITGGFGNPTVGPITIPAGPASGVYNPTFDPPGDAAGNLITTAAYQAFNSGLIPAASTFTNAYIANNVSTVATLNSNWTGMAQKLISENNNRESAAIVIEDLIPNQRTSVLSLAQGLSTFGQNTEAGGPGDFLTQILNKNTLGGQALAGALRQGKNIAILDAAGVGSNTEIPATFNRPPPQANVATAKFTKSEAANLVIR